MKKDLLTGNPSKVLLSFAIPIFLSTVFQQLYTIADSLIAGKFAGEDALAAIGASYPVTMIFMAVSIGSNTGCSVIISQLFGGSRIKDMKTAVSTALITLFALSAVITVAALAFSPQIMTFMNTPKNIFGDADLYFKIYIGGFTFLSLYNIATGVFTALGDSKTPLYFLIISSVVNVILDYVFVAEFEWGVAGAAWATFISQGAACITAVAVIIIKLKKIPSERFEFFSFPMLRNLTRVSSQTILQQSFISVGNMLVQGIVNGYGSSVIAGYAAAIKLITFCVTSLHTVANAMAAFTAQNVGANQYDRVKKGYRVSIVIVFVLAAVFTVSYVVFGEFFVNMFLESTESTKALETGRNFLLIVSLAFCIVSLKVVSDAVTRGAGAIRLFAISTFADLIIRVALSYALAPMLGVNAVAVAWTIGWLIGMVLAVCFYKFGNWKNHKLA
ncbi:MAG: MATE family efflux transporter [Clostridia bacterium]|nr:MATE family efflux transporter [Clostridia bacterium]